MNQFASVELMGHVQHIGFVTEVEIFGQKMGHIAILNPKGPETEAYFNASSVYRITPLTEERAQELTRPYEYKTLSRGMVAATEWTDCGDYEDDDEDEDFSLEENTPVESPMDGRGETGAEGLPSETAATAIGNTEGVPMRDSSGWCPRCKNYDPFTDGNGDPCGVCAKELAK